MRALLKRHQIVIFFALTLIISWFPWYTGRSGFRAWGPSLAGLIVVAVVEGRKGIGDMLRRLVRWRVGSLWWAIALLAAPAMSLVAIGIHVLTGGQAPPFTFWRQEWHLAPVFMLILLSPMGGPGGEEPFGWRGYAQPKLHQKWGQCGPLIASFIIGAAWGVWHLPEFFNPASTQYALGIGFLGPMLISWIAHSIVMTWLYNETGGSVLVAGVAYHLMLDVSSTLLVDFTVTGMLSGAQVGALADFRLLTLQIVVSALVALLLVIATRGRLGYSAADGAEA
jgi:membrane protease YdiL (CAAX protease family)